MVENIPIFSVKLITNSDGKIQPELFVCDTVENLDSTKISEIVTYFKEVKTQLRSLNYKVVENEVSTEIKNMSGWVQLTVRGTDFEEVKKKFNELSGQYPINK